MSQYPVMLKLERQPVLIVGGGAVAERKAAGLIDAHAIVTVVSPTLTPRLHKWAEQELIIWKKRTYQPSDAHKMRLVFAATNNRESNHYVYETAADFTFVCVVDEPEESSFTVPAVMKRAPLTIAVSTGGASPIIARRIKEELYDRYDDTYVSYLAFLHEARQLIKEQVSEGSKRKELFEQLVTDDIYEKFRNGQFQIEQLQQLIRKGEFE